MVVKVKDAETKRNKASVAHTGCDKRKITSTTTPSKVRLYSSNLQLLFQQKMCKSESDRAAENPDTPCDWARCAKERGLMRSSPAVLQSSLSRSYHVSFPCLFRRLQHTVDFFVAGSHFSLLRSLLSLFSSCCKSSCRLHEYKRAFFGVVVCEYLLCFPRCFSVVHLDNHGSWEHQRRFCLFSIPLANLSA